METIIGIVLAIAFALLLGIISLSGNILRDKNRTSRDFSGEKTKQLTQEQQIALYMGCDINNISNFDHLAIATVLIPTKITDEDSFLCRSDLTKCDTILFTAFVIRAILIGTADNMQAARQFSENYVRQVILGTKYLYSSTDEYFNEMFDNRMSFYDSVFMSKDDIEERLDAITSEFEFIIKNDIIQKKYVPFYKDSPLPILGILEDMQCMAQVKSFFNSIPTFVSPYYHQVQRILSY